MSFTLSRLFLCLLCFFVANLSAADNTYTNPIIDADYSDPDVIRVGDDFYLTASSFNCVPGLPILHSRDLVKARNAAGPWTPPLLVRPAKGWIDPAPFWDDDGNAYLVHAWANSRSGIKSILTINRPAQIAYSCEDLRELVDRSESFAAKTTSAKV